MNRVHAVLELKRSFYTLNTDLEAALALVRKEPSSFAKRTLIRTYFAFVEGLAHQLRQVTLASLDGTDLLGEGDRAMLKENSYRLTSSGVPEEKENFQKALPKLLFSLRVYALNHGATFEPNTSDNGWNCLKQAVRIRDRLTHPKSHLDLEVSDGDGEVFAAGAKWWRDSLMTLFAACGEADEKFMQVGLNEPQ